MAVGVGRSGRTQVTSDQASVGKVVQLIWEMSKSWSIALSPTHRSHAHYSQFPTVWWWSPTVRTLWSWSLGATYLLCLSSCENIEAHAFFSPFQKPYSYPACSASGWRDFTLVWHSSKVHQKRKCFPFFYNFLKRSFKENSVWRTMVSVASVPKNTDTTTLSSLVRVS